MAQDKKYPVTLDIDYSDKSDRLTAAFRIILIIPIFIILVLISGGNSMDEEGAKAARWGFEAGGALIIPTLLMILFRQKYPKWWYNCNVELTKFATASWCIFFPTP